MQNDNSAATNGTGVGTGTGTGTGTGIGNGIATANASCHGNGNGNGGGESKTENREKSPNSSSWEPHWDTSVYKRKKNCKKRRDPMEPQKPVSAYALFFRDTQAAIKSRNPKASFGDISKTVASMWDTLDGDTKNQYKKRTDLAKKEYLKRLAAYRARLISTVVSLNGLHHSWQNAGFCSPSPPGTFGPQTESMGHAVPSQTSINGTEVRPVTTLNSRAYLQSFDPTASRTIGSQFAAAASRSVDQNGEDDKDHPYSTSRLDAHRSLYQPLSQCIPSSLYSTYSRTGIGAVAGACIPDSLSRVYDYASQRNDRYGVQTGVATTIGGSDSVNLMRSYALSNETGNTAQHYANAVRQQTQTAASGYDVTAAHARQICQTQAQAQAQAQGGVNGLTVGNTQLHPYYSSYARVPNAGYGSYPTVNYRSYWPTNGMATQSVASGGSDGQHATLTNPGVNNTNPNVNANGSLPSCSSSSSSSSLDDWSNRRNEPHSQAPADIVAPQVMTVPCTERTSSFDYWTNAIGYY